MHRNLLDLRRFAQLGWHPPGRAASSLNLQDKDMHACVSHCVEDPDRCGWMDGLKRRKALHAPANQPEMMTESVMTMMTKSVIMTDFVATPEIAISPCGY